MTLKLTFEITLDSDYHIGAGHGQGMLIDSALQRDADGRPVLRGTTVGGLLRDGLRRLLETPPLASSGYARCQASGQPKADETPAFCGQHDARQADCPVCALFGSPRTTRRWEMSSARPCGEELPAAQAWASRGMGAAVGAHVRVSPRTRRAEEAKLFFREEGDRRLAFSFTVSCEEPGPAALDEAAWLAAAARFVEHLGAGRRRGRGQCEIHLIGIDGVTLPAGAHASSFLLDRFGARVLGLGECADATFVGQLPTIQAAARPAPRAYTVSRRVIARLDEPLIISEKGEAGNEFRGGEIIPGSALRGVLASRAAARHDLRNAATYEAFVELFFRGQARFSALLPAQHSQKGGHICPALPAPLDLLGCALHRGLVASAGGASHGAQGFACAGDDAPLTATCPRCGEDMKPFEHFIPLREEGGGYAPAPFAPARVAEMHVAIDPTTQRSDAGRLFAYDALRAGQYFVGALEFTDAAAWATFCDLTGVEDGKEAEPVRLRFGKAARRGYGAVTLWVLDAGGQRPWGLPDVRQRVPDLRQPFTLTCITDTLSLDRWGRSRLGFDAAWLSRELGQSVMLRRAYVGARGVDSYNGKVGLPRTRDMMLRAGSAVGIGIWQPLSQDEQKAVYERLEQLERSGLGLRTEEGFGQVAFNLPVYDGNRGVDDNSLIYLDDLPSHSVTPAAKLDLPGEGSLLAEWRFRLENGWNDALFGHAEFEAVALELRAAASAPKLELTKLLEHIGKLEQLGPDPAAAELRRDVAVWRANKEKINFFLAKEGKAGIDALRAKWLPDLQAKFAGDDRLARFGLRMLADRVAAAAQPARKEGKR